MSVQLNPYLNFRDTAREAMEFYQTVFGGTLELGTYGDMGMFNNPAEAHKIMHALLNGDHGIVLMGADVPEGIDFRTNSSVSLSGDDEAVLGLWWDRLSEGAAISEPLTKAPWGTPLAC
ncbi:VOC family protein [Specibacter sp. NPDC057265]|uniref:VOC family protein n=1 Tax=Specibacter sp. NPDC057265 TaxID=3346075 RepID=UPI00363CEE7D